jgi:hypothetical protein
MRPRFLEYVAGTLLLAAASGCASTPQNIQRLRNSASVYPANQACDTKYGRLTVRPKLDPHEEFRFQLDEKEGISLTAFQGPDTIGQYEKYFVFVRKKANGWTDVYHYNHSNKTLSVLGYSPPIPDEGLQSGKSTKKDRRDFRKGLETFTKAIQECSGEKND